MNDLLRTTGDVARQLRLSPDRIRQLEREGKLSAQKTLSGVRLFKASDVDRFAKELFRQEVKNAL